jgi:hypothetical protein
MAGFADAVEITLLCVACRRWRCIAVFRGFAFSSASSQQSGPILGLRSWSASGSSKRRPDGAVVNLACLVIGLCFADRQPD